LLLVYDDYCPVSVDLNVDVNLHSHFFNVVSCDILCSKSVTKRIRLFVVYIVPNILLFELKVLLGVLSHHIDSFKGVFILCGDFNLPNFESC